MNKKRGQASVEFLFTYGWAIMAITLAIGTLMYFNILTPERYLNQYCDVGAQFDCVEWALYDNGTIQLVISNNHRVDINITNITYSSSHFSGNHTDSKRINRGQNENITINANPTSQLLLGDVQRIRLELNYKRIGGVNSYMTSGTILTQVLSSN